VATTPTPAETQALSRQVAEAIGSDEAWEPAAKCPQGHERGIQEWGAGELCGFCCGLAVAGAGNAAATARPLTHQDATREEIVADLSDATWHPEWRIPRGAPKAYATGPGLILGEIESYCDRKGCYLNMERYPRGTVSASGFDPWCHAWMDMSGARVDGEGATLAEALCRAYLAAKARWDQ